VPPPRPLLGRVRLSSPAAQAFRERFVNRPGNAEINDSPPPVSFYPYGGDAFLLGGYGGGFHGGGGGHR
jgi:hypothetical protein